MEKKSGKQYRYYRKGEVLMREGEESDYFLLLKKGVIDIYAQGRKINTVNASYSQDFIGEIGVILGTPRTATVIAASNCVALYLPALGFEDIIRTTPSIAVKLCTSLCRRIVKLTGALKEFEPLCDSVIKTGDTNTSVRNYMKGLLYMMEQATQDPDFLSAQTLTSYFLKTNPWGIQHGDSDYLLHERFSDLPEMDTD